MCFSVINNLLCTLFDVYAIVRYQVWFWLCYLL